MIKERILLAPGANPTELLRSLARHGIGTFALRIVGSVELANMALMRSGVSEDYIFIPRSEEVKLICSIAGDTDINYAAAQDIAHALRSMRMLIPENEAESVRSGLEQGRFVRKNALLAEIYRRYTELCAAGDGKPFMDSVAVLRLAAEKAAPMDAEFLTLKEFPLSPLERYMLDRLAAKGVREISLPQLFERETAACPSIDSMTAAYGSTNEIEDIIGRIYEQKLPLDSCTVAVADISSYSQLFYNYRLRHGIPVTFGCGVPIINSNPAHLLQLYLEWATHGCRGVDALRNMIMSEAFDRSKLSRLLNSDDKPFVRLDSIIALTGSLRLGSDADTDRQRIADCRRLAESIEDEEQRQQESQLIERAEILGRELEKSCAEFVAEYSVIRYDLPGRIDSSAASAIRTALSGDVPLEEAAEAVLRRSVCFENSSEGHLHITGITGAGCVLREHLFVAGLSASRFPGKPSENYLLLDDDYRLISDDDYAPVSERKVTVRKQALYDLALLAATLGSSLHLSYSSVSLATLEEENPSSSMFELYRAACGEQLTTADFEAQLRHAGFFDHSFSALSLVGAEYMAGRVILPEEAEPEEEVFSVDSDRTFSPTAIEKYVQCPRKFYLNTLLRLKTDEEDDPKDILPANMLGSMVHRLMEDCSNSKPDLEQFIARANQLFDEHLIRRPPVNEADVEAVRRTYLTIAENAYTHDPGNTVLEAERSTSAVHPETGIRLHGYPDRVEQLPSGKEIIVDYKTKYKVTHVEQNVDSCIQAMLYAYMLREKGHDVTGCEYRYPRFNHTVTCTFNDDAKSRIDAILASMKAAMDSGKFPATPETGECQYCPVAEICGKES